MKEKRYVKPKVKSTKSQNIYFYAKDMLRNVDESEFLLAVEIS